MLNVKSDASRIDKVALMPILFMLEKVLILAYPQQHTGCTWVNDMHQNN